MPRLQAARWSSRRAQACDDFRLVSNFRGGSRPEPHDERERYAGGQQNSGQLRAWFDTHVQLTKLVNGGTPSASDPAFQFQLWTGLSAVTPGTLLETKTTTPGVNNVLNFSTSLVPGAQYQMCELVVNGFTPDFTGFGSFNPGGNNPGYICFNFSANTTSDTLLITVNNIHQVGLALTIGYWKNWASCASSNGKQAPSTDESSSCSSRPDSRSAS